MLECAGLGSFVKKGMVKKIGDRKSDSIVDATEDKTRKGGIQCCMWDWMIRKVNREYRVNR